MGTIGKAKAAKKPTKKGVTSKAKTSKKSVINKTDLDKKNEAAMVKAVISSRELKYIYPSHINDPLARKAWRQTVRAKLENFEKRLQTFDGKLPEKKELRKQYNDYKATVLCV